MRRSPFAEWPRPLAFVLSGGGAFGSVQVGMLQALQEHGVRPDVVVGTSVGALNGAFLAAHPDDAGRELAERWTSIGRREAFGRGAVGALWGLVRRGHLADPDALAALIDRHLPAEEFADLTLPFAAVATELMTGEPEVFSVGPLRQALLASAAVPGIFEEVRIGDRDYVDGGISANVPIRQAVAFGARSAVVLDANPPTFASRPPRTPRERVVHHANLMMRNQRAHAVDELRGRIPMVTLPSVIPADFGSFNFRHTARLIDESCDATLAFLDGSIDADSSLPG